MNEGSNPIPNFSCAHCKVLTLHGMAPTQVLLELKRLLNLYKGDQLSITVTGHSLGSALATINAYDIAQLGLNQPTLHVTIPKDWNHGQAASPADPKHHNTIPVTVFSFGGPRVGNDAFRDRIEELGVKVSEHFSRLLSEKFWMNKLNFNSSQCQILVGDDSNRCECRLHSFYHYISYFSKMRKKIFLWSEGAALGERERHGAARAGAAGERELRIPGEADRPVPIHIHACGSRGAAQQPGLAISGPGKGRQAELSQHGAVPAPGGWVPRRGPAISAHNRAPDCAHQQKLQLPASHPPCAGVLVAAREQGAGAH